MSDLLGSPFKSVPRTRIVGNYISKNYRLYYMHSVKYEDSSEFYHCGNKDCPRIKFDSAVELFFKCNNCKGPLNMVDNARVKEALRFKINQITEDIYRQAENKR